MMSYDFKTLTHAKWILVGEHSVLRGNPAIVMPLKAYQLHLAYQQQEDKLTADFTGSNGSEVHILFWSVIEHGLTLINKSINEISGHFILTNDIPIGAGMGASAALCVAIARWFHHKKWILEHEILNFGQQLEDLFHGKSSGLDITGVNSQQGVLFQHDKQNPIIQTWQPQWYLSFCGQIGITAQCVNKVAKLWEDQPQLAQHIDAQMNKAVEEAVSSLKTENRVQLANAINLSCDCFKQWDLISEGMHNHMNQLRQAGAIAVKPTGSGEGGYVLSLWDSKPNVSLPFELTPA